MAKTAPTQSECRAYLLGWTANQTTDSSVFRVPMEEAERLAAMRDALYGHNASSVHELELELRTDLVFDETQHNRFPVGSSLLGDRELAWVFVRGAFDACGTIHLGSDADACRCEMKCVPGDLAGEIAGFCGIPHSLKNDILEFSGSNCIDFLGEVYGTHLPSVGSKSKFDAWMRLLGHTKTLPKCRVLKVSQDAVLPTKNKFSDVGYDLTIVKKAKEWLNNITLYDTGIKIQVEHGYYAEVVPRSSLSKSGYMLANSVGVIDPSYTGNLFVALVKVDPTAPDIQLPFRCCQLVIRHQIHADVVEVKDEFALTSRQEGGFGSSGM
jgi:deoxyuridine 5'-triphosphate nucleotidohydrolase